MQRRAAAVYFALFVVLGAGAYTFMQVGMAEPAVDLDGPTYAEGDEFTVEGVTHTVSTIEAQAGGDGGHGGGGGVTHRANVTWDNQTGNGTEFVEIEEGNNATLAGVQHFAHFPSNSSVQVLPNDEYYAQYQQTLNEQEYFHERQNGFWGIVFLSFLGAIVLFSVAYLPTKG